MSAPTWSLPAPLIITTSPVLVATGAAHDQSGQLHTVVLHGDARVASNGMAFDGDGDYVTVDNVEYAGDAGFSIAFWMTKVACTAGYYEYLFSHAQDEAADIYSLTNSNINLYLSCETNGGTGSSVQGSVLRYNLVDAAGQWVTFDISLHDAGDFDAITDEWIDVSLSVAPRAIRLFDDGVGLADSQYGYYSEAVGGSDNLAYPRPSSLNGQLGRFNLLSDIFIGGRADLNSYRHFVGTIAFLRIWSSSLTAFEAHCAFTLDESSLPLTTEHSSGPSEGNPLCWSGSFTATRCCDVVNGPSGDVSCWAGQFDFIFCCPPPPSSTPCEDVFSHLDLDVAFLDAAHDQSGQLHTVVLHGDAHVASNGVAFDGDGDYVTVDNVEYAGDAGFSIAFWMTKVACTAGYYEYLFSHAQDEAADIYSLTNSNINLYLSCETNGGTGSSVQGSVLRYNLVDAAGQWVTFDISLHDAGDFDAITDEWIDVSLSVAPRAIRLFDDGVGLADSQYGYYSEAVGGSDNLAYPRPSSLNGQLGRFNLLSDIFIGGRADLNSYRHFVGTIAFLRIWSSSLTAFEAHCAFTLDESSLPLSTGHSSPGLSPAVDEFVTPSFVAFATYGLYTVYRLSLQPASTATSIYSIYGEADHPMQIPAAFQQELPWGAWVLSSSQHTGFRTLYDSCAVFGRCEHWRSQPSRVCPAPQSRTRLLVGSA